MREGSEAGMEGETEEDTRNKLKRPIPFSYLSSFSHAHLLRYLLKRESSFFLSTACLGASVKYLTGFW